MNSAFLFQKTSIFLLVAYLFSTGIFAVHAQSSKDSFVSELWYLKAIHVPTESQTGKESIVAVLDAGFDLAHEDLLGQFWTNLGEIPNDHRDNDHNGFEDDVHGWDFVDNDADVSPDLSDPLADDTIVSHGTLLSGIIAAIPNNGKGIVGIAPHSKIMPLRILDSRGKGTTAGVRDAIVYAVKNGVDVINLSLASTKPDDQLQQTIAWAVDQGVIVVAAVGNDHADVDRDPTFPACFDTRIGKNRVIGVAALNEENKKATFSNDGSNCVDIAAPGVDVFGAVYHNEHELLYSTSYGSPFEGTSIAAPMVSAAVARLRSAYPTMTPDQIRLALMLSADPLLHEPPEQRKRLGAGGLNVERALLIAPRFVGLGSTASSINQHPTGSLYLAQGKGTEPIVKRIDAVGVVLNTFFAYNQSFRGGVRLAAGDLNGDGIEDLVTAPGKGGGPHVRVFDPHGKLLAQFFAFDSSDRHGLNVAVGDANADGIDDILVSQDQGGSGQVRLFSMKGDLIGSFFPFGRTEEPIFVTVGNFDEDPAHEIAASIGGKDTKHRVKIFDGNGAYVRDFVVTNATGGLRVSTWHTSQKNMDQLIVSSDTGSAPWVRLLDEQGVPIHSALVFPATFRGGVQAFSGDRLQNGRTELYVIPISRGGPHVRVFRSTFEVIGGFFAFDKRITNGLSAAIWNP